MNPRDAQARTCGEWLVELLEDCGITTVFGIPGVHTVEFYRGLEKTSLRHVTPRHEQGAGFMADGYARACGKPAACFIISGPGMTNILTAMAQAYSDSVPMLVISSVNNSHELALGQGRLHELPYQRQIAGGVAVFSHTITRPDELPEVLARAWAVFDSARPGPVHIEIPLDVIVEDTRRLDAEVRRAEYPPGPDANAIARAAELLRSARDPFVVLGGGTQSAAAAARALVERLGAPTILTINAKGVLPAGHPQSLGSRLPHPPVLEALAKADVVLAVGTELGETDTLLFDGKLNLEGKIVRVDIEQQQLTRNTMPHVAICSDAGSAMRALHEALDGHEPADSIGRVRSLRAAADEHLDDAYRGHGRLLQTIADTLPGVVVVGDSTQPVYGANFLYEPDAPRRYFNSSTGYGTLGYALSAALGAKLASADKPVICVIGDGGLQFTIGELATAVELGLPVPILLWNNRGYGEIKRYMVEREIPAIGVDIYTPDFIAIAEGYGCRALRAEDAGALRAALREAAAAEGPTLIEIVEDSFEVS